MHAGLQDADFEGPAARNSPTVYGINTLALGLAAGLAASSPALVRPPHAHYAVSPTSPRQLSFLYYGSIVLHSVIQYWHRTGCAQYRTQTELE